MRERRSDWVGVVAIPFPNVAAEFSPPISTVLPLFPLLFFLVESHFVLAIVGKRERERERREKGRRSS